MLAILMGVRWYFTVVQISFKENIHREFLYCFPIAGTTDDNHSMVVVSCIADRMERRVGNMNIRRQLRDLG